MKLGVLLIGMGGPDKTSDVEPYLKNVRGGRPFSKDFLDDLVSKYAKIGGGSPLLKGSLAQASALENKLKAAGLDAKVEVGMRHWPPSLEDALKGLVAWGAERVIGLCLTPQESKWSSGGYQTALDEAVAKVKPGLPTSFVSGWHLEHGFLEALCDRVSEATVKLQNPLVVFTAHSLPVRVAAGDVYVEQLEQTAEAVSQLLSIAPTRLAFQSQSPSGEPWLGPEVGEVLEDLKDRGVKEVTLAPIGFITEHLETLYDLDILYAEKAASLGLGFSRSATVGLHPALIGAWVDLVRRAAHPDQVPGRFIP